MRTEPKVYKTYDEQIKLLSSRGMHVEDYEDALRILERVNYYRLSGYWYSFRQHSASGRRRSDLFIDGSSFDEVVALYNFDVRLRTAVFSALAKIELAFRALLGHELGRINPYVHLTPELLGPLARSPATTAQPSEDYRKWLSRYQSELHKSREDFVIHHKRKYGGRLPIWAAVEVMDFGAISYLYRFSPEAARSIISDRVSLTPAQLGSWLKSLNIVRNYSAHHARMFNRVYALRPRLPQPGHCIDLGQVRTHMNRCFGQLTLIQYLLHELDLDGKDALPMVISTYPQDVPRVPISHIGAPDNWQQLPLWSPES